MKIALCFFGQPRFVKKGYEYYKKNLIDNHDVDVFIHTWFSVDNMEKGFDSMHGFSAFTQKENVCIKCL